ncbi:Acyl-CoA carboxylase epsilon subunit [Raineyella antarctica]|uniref:Acyl-CoA carboxylase epsilon subunit n=1 Tax=Raineyella antarctica TaxID=1577474 RepID=A0A1G6H4U2_9ACTN|nr:Acyl-CoA carboxylase epsilon subunit [Raineyella antarctica]
MADPTTVADATTVADPTTAVEEPRQAAFRVVGGAPTEEELAAITVVFAALSGPGARPGNATQPRSSRYNSYWRAVRRTFATGRETWNSGIRQF